MTLSDQPDRTSSILSREVRSTEVLWHAWIAVRGKALKSPHKATREAAQQIDQNPSRTIRRIQQQLRSDTFTFEPQRGVLKKRKGKGPRPIVVSPLANRIVQRAMLDVAQSIKPSIRRALGLIPSVLDTPTAVGGIPKKGAGDAVDLISGAIANGASYFIRADIKEFFTKVPLQPLFRFLMNQTGDRVFVRLVEHALKVELENADDPLIHEWLEKFPDGEVGVPQGSSLSALCANVVLRKFDRVMNAKDCVAVRYIDDFVVLGPNERKTKAAFNAGRRELARLGLDLHDPALQNEKASMGPVSQGFNFLSFHFREREVSPSKEVKSRMVKSIKEGLRASRKQIVRSVGHPRRAEDRFVQALASVDKEVRGWGDSFKKTSRRLEFQQLDELIETEVQAFIGWYIRKSKGVSKPDKRRMLGVALLIDTPRD